MIIDGSNTLHAFFSETIVHVKYFDRTSNLYNYKIHYSLSYDNE